MTKLICETDRLRLTQLSLADAPFILELVNDPAWIHFIGDRGIRTLAQAEAYLREGPLTSYKSNGFGLYLVQRKADAARLGMCGLLQRPSLPQPDIGYALLPQYTGQGFAFEAATAVCHYARSSLNLTSILAIVLPKNERSIHLLQKLGFQFKEMVSMAADQPPLMLFQEQG